MVALSEAEPGFPCGCLYDIYSCHSLTVNELIPSCSEFQIIDDYRYLLEM